MMKPDEMNFIALSRTIFRFSIPLKSNAFWKQLNQTIDYVIESVTGVALFCSFIESDATRALIEAHPEALVPLKSRLASLESTINLHHVD